MRATCAEQRLTRDVPTGASARSSLSHDCFLFFRDLAVAAFIFVPLWTLLYHVRVMLFSH